ncbi:hypothetical protein EJ02DRAFT_485044 [Clathrospora elynae]|uniref:Uncharacterized protein n=1 Tax=Clathrospora elynae TaxID=706981 RepID=A0A6A5S7F2_9PLEO|nr:hypothetical protein EJ02DRAFT_485044 [Clathrospora elynae]
MNISAVLLEFMVLLAFAMTDLSKCHSAPPSSMSLLRTLTQNPDSVSGAINASHGANKSSYFNLGRISIAVFNPKDIATELQWDQYKSKDEALSGLVDMNDATADKEWLDCKKRKPSPESSNWKDNLQHDSVEAKNRIGIALAALGLHMKPVCNGGQNICYSVEDLDEQVLDDDEQVWEQSYTVDNKKYTVVMFALYAQYLEAPAPAVLENWDREAEPDELPTLRIVSGHPLSVLAAQQEPGDAQHKVELGNKHVICVTIIRDHDIVHLLPDDTLMVDADAGLHSLAMRAQHNNGIRVHTITVRADRELHISSGDLKREL